MYDHHTNACGDEVDAVVSEHTDPGAHVDTTEGLRWDTLTEEPTEVTSSVDPVETLLEHTPG